MRVWSIYRIPAREKDVRFIEELAPEEIIAAARSVQSDDPVVGRYRENLRNPPAVGFCQEPIRQGTRSECRVLKGHANIVMPCDQVKLSGVSK